MGNMEPPKFTVNNVIAEGDFVVAYGEMTMKVSLRQPSIDTVL
jgi:hypothetical protein